MPFFREINFDNGIKAGIWQITETTHELLDNIQLSDSEAILYSRFSHDLRKRQWLAYRVLLKHLLDPLTTKLAYDQHGKPYLVSGSHFISVSHAGEFAAVVCSENSIVGIDIEKMKDRVERVKERYLQKTELDSLVPGNRLEQLHIFWGGKEAIYKLHGLPDIDFQNDIYIHPFDYLCNTNQNCKATLTVDGCKIEYTFNFQKLEGYMLVVAFKI